LSKLKALLDTREWMISEPQKALDSDERAFLLSLARNQADWKRLGIAHAAEMPGLRWRLENLSRLAKTNPKKLETQVAALEKVLSRGDHPAPEGRAGGARRFVIARGVFTSLPDLKRKLMRYIRQYNKAAKAVKWKYFDPTRRITSASAVTATSNCTPALSVAP
jgi:hypothetical protein